MQTGNPAAALRPREKAIPLRETKPRPWMIASAWSICLGKMSPDLDFGWVLGKLVQAAVAGCASQIRFSLNAQETIAQISFPTSAQTDPQVQSYLAFAVKLALQSKPRRLQWHCQQEPIDLIGGLGNEQTLPTQGQVSFHLEHGGWSLWKNLRLLVGARGNAHHLLYQRACLSPVPVFLDAVRINSGKPLSNQRSHHAIRQAALDSMTRERLLAPAPAHMGL